MSPRLFEGPDTAEIAESDVVPITDNPESKLPVTVQSLDEVEVEVTDNSRILALDRTGSLASIVFGLGFGPNVVGRDISTGFDSAKHLPQVTDAHQLNAESILKLNPTLILTDYTIGPYDVQVQMRNSGIPVVLFKEAQDIDDIPRLITEVATTLGAKKLGEDYIKHFKKRLDATLAKIAEVAPKKAADKVRMAFLYVRGRAGVYYLFGNNPDGSRGMAGALIHALGGIDVAYEEKWESGNLTAEGLIRLEPDLLLMLTLGLESVGGIEGVQQVAGVAQTPAGQRKRIVDMSDYVMFSWGPRTPEVLIALAEAVYRVEIGEVEVS